MVQAHVFISGFVQGVGFRAYVRSKARKLGVTGWVRNLTDGRVEGVFQGERDIILRLISFCKRGPFFSKTEHIAIDWEEIDEVYTEFLRKETV